METIAVWFFFFWLSGGGPDGLKGPFESREACVAYRDTAPPEVVAVSECVQATPLKRT